MSSSPNKIILYTKDRVKISANHYSKGLRSVLIICPGFMMHKDSKPFLLLSQKLSEYFDIITIDFRGHGESSGSYTFTSQEGMDLRAVLDFSLQKYKFIGIIGFSLGAAIAINEIAKNRLAHKLIAVSAPTEFKKIENRFLNKDVIYSTIKKFDWQMGQVRLGNILLAKPKPIQNVEKISPVPILFIHGKKDTIIESWHSLALFKKAKDPKKLVMYEDGLHAEDLFFGDNFDNFISLCLNWFKDKSGEN